MKVAVSAFGNDLSSQMDPWFERCLYFVVIDTETAAFVVVPNTAVGSAHEGGILAA